MTHPQTTFIHTELTQGSFLERKRQVVWERSLLYQLDVLKKTGRYDAFRLKWHPSYNDEPDHWPIPNHLFWDSDVAKWIESACYFLHTQRSDTIEAAVDDLVHMIRKAQRADGYLNIHFTVVAPKERFKNIRDLHELYNAGHLIEAAIAHQRLYGNQQLLEPILRYVDLLYHTFGPGPHQSHGYPGHPEIELALLRLYELTQEPRHLMLAEYFIDERGNPKGVNGRHFYTAEAEKRGERPYERPSFYPYPQSYWYQQAHKPIVDQDSIQGHSVRAMYLLTAVADLERYRNREGYRTALLRLWRNMVEKKMYLTGGIGAIKQWEGFGIDYFLPQSTDEGGCYNETCAGIGVMMLAERLLQIDLDGQYGDIMELCLYNSVLAGMSCDGRRFAYTNQLASSDNDLSKRSEWFTTSCCPPNVSRTFGFLSGYMWSFTAENTSAHIKVHMFGSARLTFPVGEHAVELIQRSDWPWEGHITMELKSSEKVQTRVSLRIPAWASEWEISPRPPRPNVDKGYLHLPADWLQKNPRFSLSIPITPRLLTPHPFTNMEITALARGPLIYCIEDVDNTWVDDHFRTLTFDPSSPIFESTKTDVETSETYIMLTASGPFPFLDVNGLSLSPGVISNITGQKKANFIDELYFIPYYYRANRAGKGHMRVGLRKTSANRTSFFS